VNRRLLGLLLVVALLGACTSGPTGGPSPSPGASPTGQGQRMLAELGRALGADPSAPEVQRIHPPECPDDYDRVLASASYDGRRVSVDRVAGRCPRGDRGYFACHGEPVQAGHAVELAECTTRTLEDGRVVVAGRLVVYQESESLLAALTDTALRCVVTADAAAGVTLEELARAVAEIRCE
jgi:hypothetical protein